MGAIEVWPARGEMPQGTLNPGRVRRRGTPPRSARQSLRWFHIPSRIFRPLPQSASRSRTLRCRSRSRGAGPGSYGPTGLSPPGQWSRPARGEGVVDGVQPTQCIHPSSRRWRTVVDLVHNVHVGRSLASSSYSFRVMHGRYDDRSRSCRILQGPRLSSRIGRPPRGDRTHDEHSINGNTGFQRQR